MSFSFGNPASTSSTTPSLFGSTTPSAKPLFGNATPSTTPSTSGGLFGGAKSASTVSTTPTLFGSATAQSPSAGTLFGAATTAAGGPFGSTPSSQPAATSQSATPTLMITPADSSKPTSLFGGANTQSNGTGATAVTSTPAGFGGFGSAQSNTGQAAAATSATPAKPMFGALGGALSSTPTQSGPTLFSQPSTAAPAAQGGIGGSLFGQSTAKPLGGSLFTGIGQQSTSTTTPLAAAGGMAAAPAQGSSLFGGQANSNAAGTKLSTSQPVPLFSLLGTAMPAPSLLQPQQSLQQPQQVVPGVKIDLSNIKPTTRFFELHENLQKQIEFVDNFIQSQVQLFAKCEAFMPGHSLQLKTIPGDFEFVKSKYDTVTQALDRDASDISSVKDAVQSDIGDARRSFAAIETLKLPAQFQYSIGYTAPHDKSSNDTESNAFASTDLTPYFEEQIKDLEKMLRGFGQQLGEIEAHLRTVDSSATEQAHKLLRRQAGEDPSKERVQELGQAMRIFEDAVFRVASKVGEAREGVIECTMGKSTVNGTGRSPQKGR